MKPAIHPDLHVVKVHCGCGNEFETYSTTKEIRLELCGSCHPFYTGKKRDFAAAGRVQRFADKYKGRPVEAVKAPKPPKAAAAPKAVKAPKAAKTDKGPKAEKADKPAKDSQ